MNHLNKEQAETFLKNLRLSNYKIITNLESEVNVLVIEIPETDFELIRKFK